MTPRYEPAGFPTLGGDTDTGALVGVATSLTRFGEGVRPYEWNLNVVTSVSFKNVDGFRLVQQNYLVAFDLPRFEGSDVRLMPETSYVRAIDAPYFGRGNAATPQPPPGTASPATYDQYLSQTFLFREITRVAIHRPYELVFEPRIRYTAPVAYPGSRLASDVGADGANGAPLVAGLRDETLLTASAGIIEDSRDDQFYPKHGVFHQLGLKYTFSVPGGGASYGSLSGVFAGYVSLGGELVLALRGVADFDVGTVPFFDLYTGGPFQTTQLVGGSTGVRGVPLGLFSGLVKAVGNVEVRDFFAVFHVLRQKIRLGGDVFFDAGRAFDDYRFTSPRDGTGLGVHWGTGAGFYVGWGDAALVRIEVAGSPDAFPLRLLGGAGAPLGIYVEDGMMF